MKTKITKWGNSLGVRLPKTITDQKQLVDGSSVQIVTEDDQIVIRAVDSKVSLTDLLSQVRDDNLHTETKWGKPVGNEQW